MPGVDHLGQRARILLQHGGRGIDSHGLFEGLHGECGIGPRLAADIDFHAQTFQGVEAGSGKPDLVVADRQFRSDIDALSIC